jgi:hypothetical protein
LAGVGTRTMVVSQKTMVVIITVTAIVTTVIAKVRGSSDLRDMFLLLTK